VEGGGAAKRKGDSVIGRQGDMATRRQKGLGEGKNSSDILEVKYSENFVIY